MQITTSVSAQSVSCTSLDEFGNSMDEATNGEYEYEDPDDSSDDDDSDNE